MAMSNKLTKGLSIATIGIGGLLSYSSLTFLLESSDLKYTSRGRSLSMVADSAVVFGLVLMALGIIFYNKIRKPEKIACIKEAREKYIKYMKSEPLAKHHLCTSCGWIGYLAGNTPQYTGTKVVGTAAAVGGTATAAAGCGGSAIGIVLIIIGIPLLLLFGLGIIPIAIGVILLIMGGTAASAGTAIAATGAAGVSNANRAAAQAQKTPSICPSCKNLTVIPATSPVASQFIESNATLRETANSLKQAVIQSLDN